MHDTADDLMQYLETKRRADELIDETVYALYGLDEEEIKIVEAAVGGD